MRVPISGDAEGCERAAAITKSCLEAIPDPEGDKRVESIRGAIRSGVIAADAADIIAIRAVELSGPGAAVAIGRTIAGEDGGRSMPSLAGLSGVAARPGRNV